MKTRKTLQLLVAGLFAVGCATTAEGTNPDDMSAKEHSAHAKKERSVADAHKKRYDPTAKASQGIGGMRSDDWWPEQQYNPTKHHLTSARRHTVHARQHADAAEALEKFETASCRHFASHTRASCPLVGAVIKVEDIPGGARLHLAPDVNLEAVLDHSKCHLAFGRTEGHADMPACPLYVKELIIGASAEDQTLTLTSIIEGNVADIRRRARTHLPTPTK